MSSSDPKKTGSVFGGSEEAHIVPDAPPMRAVAMMSSGPTLIHAPPSFGKAPKLGVSRPPASLKPLSLGARGTSFDMQKEWRGVSSPSTWNVKGEYLEQVGSLDFPLERTHREIYGVDAPTVSARIAKCLRDMSVDAEYDCKAAKAKCQTNDCVSFRIRMFAAGENGLPVVVEVQKRSGSASSFMRSCRAILDAAEGKAMSNEPAKKMRPFMKPVSEMKCLAPVVNEADFEKEAASALDSAINMLRSSQKDSNVLGLENLASLTDPLKTNSKVALIVAKCIAMGDQKFDVREEIRLLTERDTFSTDEQTDALARHSNNLRHLALVVLSNALAICAKDGCLATAVTEQQWFTETLIPSLVDELKRAEANACNAHQAACCLNSLISSSPQTRQLVIDNKYADTLEEAYAYGDKFHALLAEETSRCLDALDTSA